MAWLVRAKGSLRAIGGTARDGADGRFVGEIIFDPVSVDIKIKKRDDRLRLADFFDVVTSSIITFAITEPRTVASGNVHVVGNLSFTVGRRHSPCSRSLAARVSQRASLLM